MLARVMVLVRVGMKASFLATSVIPTSLVATSAIYQQEGGALEL